MLFNWNKRPSPPDCGFMLSDAQIEEFHQRGVLKIDANIDPAVLDGIVAGIHPHYDQNALRENHHGNRVQDGWKLVDEVRQLAVDERIRYALWQLYERKPLAFQTLNFPIGTGQLAHSDTIHFSSKPQGYMAGVWVALEDIDEDNGPLQYYPGSHKLPYLSMQDLELEPGYQNYHLYEHAIARLVEEHGFQAEYGLVRKGEAIIWHANLLHGGAPQKDQSRSRHSQVTHYYFKGCRYYTPMESTAKKKHWREPVWIPERPIPQQA